MNMKLWLEELKTNPCKKAMPILSFPAVSLLGITVKELISSSELQAQAMKNMPRHKCAICGRTEKDDPDLEFRYCSKCEGNYEYCQDHLFTHEHVGKKDETL